MPKSFHRQLRHPRTGRLPARLARVILSLLLITQAALAVPGRASSSTVQSFPEITPASAGAFADQKIPRAMRDEKIPGAVFVVVRGDRVICEKAYGVANLATRRTVSTEDTLFRVASISKILTAAAALQLVVAGRLNLHRNVNDYLTQFRIAPAFDAPITLYNLLTHSSGFDQDVFGYAARSPAGQLSLRAYLEQHQPARVRPPGQFSVYDNYGFTLAGYLVQQAAGVPFADYVRERLFSPLDMEHSSFTPDAALQPELATGYWLDEGTPRVCGPNYININPAAGLCTTAADMGHLLVALLANQRPDGGKMFSANTLAGLETAQFVSQPGVPGWCFGFDQITLAGRSALRQPGQWPGFNSVLLLFPQQHCGLFLAYNLCDYEHLDRRISRDFAEHFIAPDRPASTPDTADLSSSPQTIDSLLGEYLSARSTHDAPELGFPREVDVTRSRDGHLKINGNAYDEIEPLVFAKVESNGVADTWSGQRVAFRLGDDGEATHLITQNGAYRQTTWLESRHGRRFLLRTLTVVFLSAVIVWPIMLLIRLMFANITPGPPLSLRRRFMNLSIMARATALATCALALWFELSLALVELRQNPFHDFYGLPASVRNLLWALPVLLGLTGALVFFAAIAWHRRLWHPAHRLHYTLLAVACGVFVYLFYSEHLLFLS